MNKVYYKQLPPVGFVKATKYGFKNLFNYKGRSRRSEFWWFFIPWSPIVLTVLFMIFLPLVITLCIPYRTNMTDEEYMIMEMKNLPYDFLGIMIPVGLFLLIFLGSMIRRLHDVNISSSLGYLAFVLYFLSMILFYVVYYYDPISFYSFLGVTLNEANKGVSVYAFIVPILFLFVSLTLYGATLFFCAFDGKKNDTIGGGSSKYLSASNIITL